MDDYCFRIRFVHNWKGQFVWNDIQHTFSIPGIGEATLEVEDGENIGHGEWLTIRVCGFQTEDAARNAVQHMRHSLLALGVELNIGFNLFGTKTVGINRNSRETQEETLRVRGFFPVLHRNGHVIFKNHPNVRFQWFEGQVMARSYTAERFVASLGRLCESLGSLGEKEALAIELFNASKFEQGGRSRFLTGMLCLEALVEDRARDEKTVQFVDNLVEDTSEAAILDSDKQSIMSSLNRLKYRSIRQGLQEFVASGLPDFRIHEMPAGRFVLKCYDIRSRLVHTGRTDLSCEEFSNLCEGFQHFLLSLLRRHLGIAPPA
jgi:hypothetical protein